MTFSMLPIIPAMNKKQPSILLKSGWVPLNCNFIYKACLLEFLKNAKTPV